MREKMIIMSNALALTLLGVRIGFLNRLLAELFRKRKLLFLCPAIDGILLSMRKEFIMLEKRQLSFLCLDI